VSDVRITPTEVIIDGHDVADMTHSVTAYLDADGNHRVTLHLAPLTPEITMRGAIVKIDAATRGALVALGWTPPGEAS